MAEGAGVVERELVDARDEAPGRLLDRDPPVSRHVGIRVHPADRATGPDGRLRVEVSDGEATISDELSLVDCTLGPLLWRLPHYGVKLGKPGVAVENYAHRIFSRSSFKASLTQAERDLLLNS